MNLSTPPEVHQVDSIVDTHLNAGLSTASEFCKVYAAARPILSFAHALLFWKPAWRRVLEILIAGLDSQCPETP